MPSSTSAVPDRQAAGLRHHDLRRDVGPRGRNRQRQPRPGLPRHRRAARGARRGDRRHQRRTQSVSARARDAGAAPRHRRPPAALLRADLRPRHAKCWSPPARPRRWPPRCSPCSTPATKSWCSSRCTTATRRASRWPARSQAGHRCARPTYTFDLDEFRAAVTPKTKLILVNTPHNPTGRVFTREEVQFIADLAIEHDCGGHRRGVRAPGVRRRAAHRDGDAARHAGAHAGISSGGKTFNTTGWKIGWICGPAALVTAGADGQAVPHVRQRRTVPAGDRARPRAARRVLRRPRRRPAGQARSPDAGARRGRLHRVPHERDLLRHGRHPPVAARRRRDGVLSGAAASVWCRRHSQRGALRNKHEGRHLVRFAFCKHSKCSTKPCAA